MQHHYGESTYITEDGPFAGNFVKALGALCPDGKRRTAFPSGDGYADTFFSVPAYVHAGGKRVYGYVTTDEDSVRFVPYLYRKHHALVQHPPRPDDLMCLECGRTCRMEGTSGHLHPTHEESGSFLCDVEAYRASDERNPEEAYLRTHARIRETQSFRIRTEEENAPISVWYVLTHGGNA
jgi:hypothetical protein